MKKKLLIFQNQWSPTYPFVLKGVMDELKKLGVDFDYFVYDNDIRLNIFDKDIVNYYSQLPLVNDIDPEKYIAIVGEYDRKVSAGVFQHFLSEGKKVIGYDYSTFDLYSCLLEGSLRRPIPITHWLTTSNPLSNYIRSNKGETSAEYIKTVGNLYLEHARLPDEEKKQNNYFVFCTNSYEGAIADSSTVRKFCFRDNIKKIEDTTQLEVKIRLHPSMYTAYNQIRSASSTVFKGGVGFQTEKKIKHRMKEFKVQNLEDVYDKIINPSEVLKVSGNAHSTMLTILTSTMRELVLNNRNYFCNVTPCRTQYNYFYKDNTMLRQQVHVEQDFFPLMQDRFIDLNTENWIQDLCNKFKIHPEFSGEYLDHQRTLQSQSVGVSTNIAKEIKDIIDGI